MRPTHGKTLLRDNDRVHGMGRQADGNPGRGSAARNPVQGNKGAGHRPTETGGLTMETTFEREFDKAVDRLWEEQTAPAVDGETLRQAGRSLRLAAEDLDKSADWVNEARETLKDTIPYDRVASILNEMEDILSTIRGMMKNFERGVVS